MDKNGHDLIQGEFFWVQGTNQNSMLPTNLVHVVVGPGRGTWDRTNQQIIKDKHPGRFRDDKNVFFENMQRTKMTAFAKSINLRNGWTDVV